MSTSEEATHPKKKRREEQEPASERVDEVGDRVLRMQLPINMPGLGHVNMYALLDDRGAAVVDPGLPGKASWRAVVDRLKRADLAVSDVHTVIVTHSHPDHFGGAARFAREAGAEVVAHGAFKFGVMESSDEPEVSVDDLTEQQRRADAEAEARSDDPEENTHQHVIERWNHRTPWGGEHPKPGFKTRMKWRAARWLGRSFIPVVTKPVAHGDVLRLAGREWFVTHTPGHTEDHICLHDPADGLFLAGDHVLPTITPHISGLSLHHDPLDAFFESLDLAGETRDVSLALPAHGHPFEDLKKRTQEIKEHHYDRLDVVRRIGRELGPATVQAFSQKLFRPRSWGGMAESETFAHLEHLRHQGNAEVHRDGEGMLIYETG